MAAIRFFMWRSTDELGTPRMTRYPSSVFDSERKDPEHDSEDAMLSLPRPDLQQRAPREIAQTSRK